MKEVNVADEYETLRVEVLIRRLDVLRAKAKSRGVSVPDAVGEAIALWTLALDGRDGTIQRPVPGHLEHASRIVVDLSARVAHIYASKKGRLSIFGEVVQVLPVESVSGDLVEGQE